MVGDTERQWNDRGVGARRACADLLPKLAAELGGTGRMAAGVAGSIAVDRGAAGSTDRQTACLRTRGEDSALVTRFIALPR